MIVSDLLHADVYGYNVDFTFTSFTQKDPLTSQATVMTGHFVQFM